MNTVNSFSDKTYEAIKAFNIEESVHGNLIEITPYGNGHINDTFLVRYETPNVDEKRYILQRMNHIIFKNPLQLMENMVNVTNYLRNIIISQDGNPERETLNVLKTNKGESCHLDSAGNYWRLFSFIENSICLEKVESPNDFYDCAVAFGNFQKMLSDFPAEILYETIPNFHNTPSRFRDFKKAVNECTSKRIELAKNEIAFALEREKDTTVLTDLLQKGQLPLRVTHNDTKLNNILFDKATRKALCIIDLDTVMPGLSLYDFGDSIRFGANTAAEDETDLDKVSLDLSLFEVYTRGYIKGCAGSLTDIETDLLPMGAKLMTYECGLRFLTDYLTGDTYFKIHRENHNLERAANQFKLVADMEAKWNDMISIVEKYK